MTFRSIPAGDARHRELGGHDRVVRCHIAGTEPLTRHLLTDAIVRQPGTAVVGASGDAFDGNELARRRPDVLFLDARMEPRALSAYLARCESSSYAMVLVSAVAADACDAFSRGATDFLLLPFSRDRVAAVLTHVRRHLDERRILRWAEEAFDVRDVVPASARPAGTGPASLVACEDRIAIGSVGGTHLVPIASIEAVVTHRDRVTILTTDGTIVSTSSLSEFERRLRAARFVRTHRRAIVNTDTVRRLEGTGADGGILELNSGATIPVARRRIAAVKHALLSSAAGAAPPQRSPAELRRQSRPRTVT